MEKRNTQTKKISGRFGAALALTALLLALFASSLTAQNPYPDYDFKAVNPDGDTLYYRITSSTAPYTVAVTRCHDSVYHTLPMPQIAWEVGQPGFLYPVYDYDSLITIPASVSFGGQTYTVTAIDKEAFYMQKSMHTVILPTSVEIIDSGAFCGSSLHQILMSPNVKRINCYAFMSTDSLNSIELPESLTHIGMYAFEWSSLNEVEIPSGVTVLPYMAFYKCPLTKIIFHEGLQEIEALAFSANHIDSLVFPKSLQKIEMIEEDTYNTGDTILCRYVEFQNGSHPLELGDNCFWRFAHLEEVILSDNITHLGKNCFESTNIRSVVIPPLVDTIPEYCFAGCGSLYSVTLPQQLSVIDKRAFSGTPSLTEISFPASLTVIGEKAFGNGLRIINCYSEVPPAVVYNNHPSFPNQDTVYVRVPCGKTAVYQSAPGWSGYSNFIYEECVGVEEREIADFKVYPNPVENVVFIELSGGAEIANIALYDLQGRMVTGVCDTPQHGATATINVKSIPAGVYILRVTDTDGKEYHRKIVRK